MNRLLFCFDSTIYLFIPPLRLQSK